MSQFKRYLEEAEYAAGNPIPGDQFDILLPTGRLFETRVIKLLDDGFVVESLEDYRGEQDSISPVHGEDQDEDEEPEDITGHMSPINGHAFLDYDVKKDPRKWFTKSGTPKDVEAKKVTLMGVPGPLAESRIYLLKPNGDVVKTKWRFIN